MMSFPKAYVLHCKSLTSRMSHMQSALDALEIERTWITEHDAVELDESTKKQFYACDRKEAALRSHNLWGPGTYQDRELTLGEISIAIKHTTAMQMIASSEDEMAFIFEDDCLFHEEFRSLFPAYLSKTPDDWDVIHVGNGYGMKPERFTSVHSGIAYKMSHPASRCAEAILVRKRAASMISSTMKPFHLAADWELGYQYWHHNLNVYWWEPALITQGSHAGFFKSSLRG